VRPLLLLGLALPGLGLLACVPWWMRISTSDHPPLEELVEADPDIESRDLFYGPGGRVMAPTAQTPFRFERLDTSGWNDNYEVEDPNGIEWDAKVGGEVRSEIVVSRLLWGVGFHQPPMYYLRDWKLIGGPVEVGPEARMRPDPPGWDKRDTWDWRRNPFVGTTELNGLIVAMALVNNWDVKTSNNAIYERERETPRRIYVVKDLGRSLGHSIGWFWGGNDEAEPFSKTRLISDVNGDEVELDFDELILTWGVDGDIHVDDVLWICRRFARLSPKQWNDAFRAAGYDAAEARPFIETLQRKVREGLALEQHAQP
jgi:hypothetical protein